MTSKVAFDIFHKLHNGESVVCPFCNQGELIAPFPEIQHISHSYRCTACGANFEQCPNVIVE